MQLKIFPQIPLAASLSLSVILTVLPQVNNLVESSKLCGPIAQQYGVLGSQMKLFLEEVLSKYNEELSDLRKTIFIKFRFCKIILFWNLPC